MNPGPRRLRLKPAEIALFVIPVLLGLFVFLGTKLRARHTDDGPPKPANYSIDTVAVSPDGTRVATGDHNGAIKWWDAGTGKPRATLQAIGGWCICVAWSRDGRIFTATSNNTLLIFDGVSGKLLHSLKGSLTGMGTLAISPDHKLAAVGEDAPRGNGEIGMIGLFDTDSGKRLATLDGNAALIAALDFSPDGKSLVAYDAAYRSDQPNVPVPASEVVQLWDLKTRSLQWESPGEQFGAAKFSPDGRRIAIGGFKPSMRDPATGAVASEMKVNGGGAWYLNFQAGGEVLAGASNGFKQPLAFWDASTGDLLFQCPLDDTSFGGTTDAFSFSRDEKRLAYIDANNNMEVWDTSKLDLKKLGDDVKQIDNVRKLWTLNTLTGKVEVEKDRGVDGE